MLPMQDADLAIKEMERCVKELGFPGVRIGSHVNGWNLNHPNLFPIFQRAEELDACLFVHPWHGRQGWATALVTRVVRGLLVEGASKLESCAHLANEASLAWHQRFGFREVPDFWIASYRARFYAHELERRKDLSEAERAQLGQLADYWWAETHRLDQWRCQEYASAYPKAE